MSSISKLKHIALAVVAVSALSSAHAANFAAPTSALLTLSSDITTVLASATFAPLGTASYNSVTSTLNEAFSSVTLSSSTGSDLVGVTNAADGFSLNYKGTALNITNISYDNATKTLGAVMSVGGVQTYAGAFLTATTVTNSEAFNAVAGTGLLTTGNLNLTDGSATALLSAFAAPTSALYVGIVKGVNFGTLAVDVTAPVPEPSTYALMGIGLVGIVLTARKRRQA
ncbi:MAG: PEP-CTERM sorting domain-containing protein [Burkholderiales bacterium]|nr:PEP-CTERM sorting domain-containing protein [Burkholderiales bacterium]